MGGHERLSLICRELSDSKEKSIRAAEESTQEAARAKMELQELKKDVARMREEA